MQNISDYGMEFISSYEIDHLRNSIFGLSFRKRYIESFKFKHWPMLDETFHGIKPKNDVRRAIRLFFYSNRHRKSYLL